MGGTSTISGGKLCLRIDPRVPMLSGCAASRGPTIKANTVPFSWIMASIHEEVRHFHQMNHGCGGTAADGGWWPPWSGDENCC
jgi:hypothetical protein